MTGREIIKNTVEFKHSGRIGRQLWTLPRAGIDHPQMLKKNQEDFPDDIVHIGCGLKSTPPLVKGDPHEVGEYTDEFGCMFTNIQRGIFGESKKHLVNDDDWNDVNNVYIPEEWLTFDVKEVNKNIADCGEKYAISGMCANLFERLQHIRGSENFYADLMYPSKKMMEFIEKLHDFFCRILKKWALTDVDALMIMDDWGAQNALLINPKLFKSLFLPMYKEYIDIAHKAGKRAFMHSDGYILDIIPMLIDSGLDAINSQIFCMDFEKLKQYAGKITFWGELDRQHILPRGTRQQVIDAVYKVYENLYENGGVIAQCEFGFGTNPDNVYQLFETWNNINV